METSSSYLANIDLLKQLRTTVGRQSVQAPYSESFEAIYQKAMQSDVKLDSAKSFLQGLSSAELTILQKYDGLADAVDVGSLSAEGAYNILMHDYEKYDFNGDGTVQDGAANMAPVIPTGMSDDVKSAYIASLNSLNDNDRLTAMTLTLDIGRLNSQVNGTPYAPQKIDYDYLSKRVNDILHPQPQAYSSDEVKRSIGTFWEKFLQNYKNRVI